MSLQARIFPNRLSINVAAASCALLIATGAAACTTPTPTAGPVATSTPAVTRLAPTVAVPTQAPVTAPDGLAVAFVADGTLWLWRTAEEPLPLTRADAFPAPTLSTDGNWIAFTREGGAVVIAADGANEQAVASAVAPDQYVWRPGQAELYLMSASEGATAMARFDPTSGSLTELGAFAADAALTFAADGEHLAIAAPDRLQLADAAGEVIGEALEYPAVAVSDTQRWRPTPVWIDDSTVRVFTITETGIDAETVVWEVGLDRAAEEVARQAGAAFGALLSPDGQHLLFVQTDQTLGMWDLGSDEARQVVDAPGASAVSWTPDSAAFVYTGIDPLQPFILGLEADATARPVGTGPVLSLRWLWDEWALYTSVAGAGEQLRLVAVGASDGLIGISSGGAIGFDAVSTSK
jgi:hypothetical protein